MRRSTLLSVLVSATTTGAALGQERSQAEVRSLVEDAAVAVEAAFGCDLSVSGVPVFEQFGGKWTIAFFATGEDCDAASADLERRVSSSEIQPYRRPDLGQVKAIIRRILTDVRASGCSVALREEPRFDESSGQWFVPYRASGNGCADADAFLQDVGAEQQIMFFSVVSRQDLLIR